MSNPYILSLSFDQGQAHLELSNQSNLNRKWFGKFAIYIYAKALPLVTSDKIGKTLSIKKNQLQGLFLDITNIYQRALIKHNIERDLSTLQIPSNLSNITQSLLLMIRMNSDHQNYNFIQNYYFEEYRTLNSDAMNDSLDILITNKLIQKIVTNDNQAFFDQEPTPHNHIYFKNQNKLIDCNNDCYEVLSHQHGTDKTAHVSSPKVFEIEY
jgi:hypothetical protein